MHVVIEIYRTERLYINSVIDAVNSVRSID